MIHPVGTRRNSSRAGQWLMSAALCGMLTLTGCTQLADASKDGEKLDADAHSAMSRGDWKSIYADADPQMRSDTSEEKFGALFTAIAKKLGNPVSSKQTRWNLNATTSGTYLRSECETKFSNNASGTETFEWKKTDGKYRLYSYHISSDDLITR
jgi:hypothetical protein